MPIYFGLQLARPVCQEFQNLVILVKNFKILGDFEVQALEQEELARKNARRSLVSLRKISKGKIIEAEDLTFKRPASGISPKYIDEVVGKAAINDIDDDIVMQWSMLE